MSLPGPGEPVSRRHEALTLFADVGAEAVAEEVDEAPENVLGVRCH
jgi:hypothetical protein